MCVCAHLWCNSDGYFCGTMLCVVFSVEYGKYTAQLLRYEVVARVVAPLASTATLKLMRLFRACQLSSFCVTQSSRTAQRSLLTPYASHLYCLLVTQGTAPRPLQCSQLSCSAGLGSQNTVRVSV
jgi:hypothetical protein